MLVPLTKMEKQEEKDLGMKWCDPESRVWVGYSQSVMPMRHPNGNIKHLI